MKQFGKSIQPYLPDIEKMAEDWLLRAQSADYTSMKRGPDPEVLHNDDLAQFAQDGRVKAGTTIADKAIVGTYKNPLTNATFDADGGPYFGLDSARYGKSGWANSFGSAAKSILKMAQHGGGLILPYAAARDAVLASYGPMAMMAEMRSALENGTATEKELLDLVNYSRQTNKVVSAKITADVQSLDELAKIIDANTSTSSFAFRRALTASVMSKNQMFLPNYDQVIDLLTDQRLKDRQTGQITNGVYIDPTMPPIRAIGLGVPDHAIYPANLPGINLGIAPGMVHIREFFPELWDHHTNKLVEEYKQAGNDPDSITDGMIYRRFKRVVDTQYGGKIDVPLELLERLTTPTQTRSNAAESLASPNP
ncbi:MAG TPA: hypothetical protein VKU00_26350 [Chthonomonadaceae bacterium]|nr:hypothetical protein [Chthonomonadaceae bacterium]